MNWQRHSRSFRTLLATVTLATVLALDPGSGAEEASATSGTTLNVTTWGGAYGQSQEITFFEPFVKETGTVIATQIYDGSLAKLKGMIDSGTPIDVVDVSAGTLSALCSEGLLEQIETSALGAPSNSASIEEDFFAGGLPPCGVASVAWSMAIAFDRQAFRKGEPTEIGALLDATRFPGKRALPKNPRYTLELALLADGVPPENVYSELETTTGVDRAFAALDKIKSDVLFWDSPDQPISWLVEGKVAMAAGYSGRLFRAAVGDDRISILWDGQIYDIDAWAIPKASDNKEEAMRFIRFATSPERLAAQAQLIAYGPMRKSAVPLVGKHPVIDVDMQGFLPTASGNFAKALQFDEGWWKANGGALAKRFAAWQAPPEPAPDAKDADGNEKETTIEGSGDNAAP